MQAYAGSGGISVQSADLNRLILDIKRLLQVSVSQRSHLHFELADDLPAVMIDGPQIRQVLMNLVTNAAESMGEQGGEIMIRTGVEDLGASGLKGIVNGGGMKPGLHVWCEVRDSGCGMADEVADRVFDPFFTTKFAGRGLGMSAALGIIKGHDGGFRMQTGPDSGSTISFLLPAHRSVDPAPRRRSRRNDKPFFDLTGKLVLVVDDDPQVRAVGESFLRRLGCRVLSAGDGFEAIRIFGERHRDIDAVLLDFTMAGMAGMSSGYDLGEIESKTSKYEIAGFVGKPYSLKVLREVLSAALSGAGE
jgi:hypothetical protein